MTAHRGGKPRRPAFADPATLEERGGSYDPTEEVAAAHESARILVEAGRSSADPVETGRLIDVLDELGMEALAELWAGRPADTLPGALWRLYAVRQWVRIDPDRASREYAAGVRFATVNHVVAGVGEPAGPQEVAALVETILAGVFRGDLGVALHRAAAFCRVVSSGRADIGDEERAADSAADLLTTATELDWCAQLWRAGRLH